MRRRYDKPTSTFFSGSSPSRGRLSQTPRSSLRRLTGATSFYAGILQQCASTRSVEGTRRVHLRMLKSGFPFLRFGNKLVHAYLKCDCTDDARRVFDVMPRPHIVSWNGMISSYVRHNRSEEAVSLYRVMLLYGIMPDEYTYSCIFRAFAEEGLLFEGRKAHGRMLLFSGTDSTNAFVASALINMYVEFGRLFEARMIFNRVGEKDVVLFTAMIVGYTQNGEDQKALLIYGDMIKSGVRGNAVTYASVLIACGNAAYLSTGLQIHGAIVKSGFESDNQSQTSLLNMYSKFSLVDESLEIFNQMKNPNAVTCTAAVDALTRNHREERALSMFRGMLRGAVDTTEFTLSVALRACSALASFTLGKQIHARALKIGLDGQRFVGAALVDMYGKCGNVKMARLVFDGLKKIELVCMNSMIYGYAQNGNGCEAVRLFDLMHVFGLKPTAATFVSVLSACSSSGLQEDGHRIFNSITNHCEAGPTKDHYACFIDLLGRAGKLQEAECLIRTKVKNPDAVIWRSFLSACKIHGSVEMAESAASKLLELDPNDHGTHVLLSNIYATSGKWHEVIRLKKVTREIKLKKEPAMTWVEINNEVHTFVAGDTSHTMKREIYAELDTLIEETMELGYVPDVSFVLQNMHYIEKEKSLYYHSEKLAIAFAVLSDRSASSKSSIMIFKNLRVCGDCHNWIKLVSTVIGREIIARDAKRFHHFKDGLCSCGDHW